MLLGLYVVDHFVMHHIPSVWLLLKLTDGLEDNLDVVRFCMVR